MKQIKKKIKDLTDKIIAHNTKYYIDDDPVISDFEYDKMYKELEDLLEEYPVFITDDSPIKKVGAKLSDKFTKVKHQIQMYSLNNAFNEQDIKDFIMRIENETGKQEYYLEPKYDGLAIELVYKDGKLIESSTRGDGLVGEDVKANVNFISDIPKNIDNSIFSELTVRGEVYMTKTSFNNYNKKAKVSGKKLLKNCRNGAAGSLRQLNPLVTEQRNLSFFAYDYIGKYSTDGDVFNLDSFRKMVSEHTNLRMPTAWEGNTETQCFKMFLLTFLGFKAIIPNDLCKTYSDIHDQYMCLIKSRSDIDFDIDGMVIKVDNIEVQKKLGNTSKFPKWAIAWKFPAEEATTILEDVSFQTSKTGVIAPVGLVKPVFVGGVTVSNVTLHNEKEIREKDLKIGDTVIIRRAGDVIPELVRPILEKRDPKTENTIVFPTICPSCSSSLTTDNESSIRYCTNRLCKAQVVGKITFGLSKKCFDIKDIGEKTIESLVSKGIVKDLYDILIINKDMLLESGLGEVMSTKILKNIENGKTIYLDKFLRALQIPNVGTTMCKDIAETCGTLDMFLRSKGKDLISIEGIGEKTNDIIVEWIEENSCYVRDLESVCTIKTNNPLIGGKRRGEMYVITGSFEGHSRDELAKLLEEEGAKISKSVTKKTTALIVGSNPGNSKMSKARSLSTPIVKDLTKL